MAVHRNRRAIGIRPWYYGTRTVDRGRNGYITPAFSISPPKRGHQWPASGRWNTALEPQGRSLTTKQIGFLDRPPVHRHVHASCPPPPPPASPGRREGGGDGGGSRQSEQEGPYAGMYEKEGRGVSEGGFGWDPPSCQGPPVVPAEGRPKILKLKSSWHRRRRSEILLPSAVHLEERLKVSQSVS